MLQSWLRRTKYLSWLFSSCVNSSRRVVGRASSKEGAFFFGECATVSASVLNELGRFVSLFWGVEGKSTDRCFFAKEK